jgi:rare lipoprotein A
VRTNCSAVLLLLAGALLLSGCGHRSARVNVPPPPSIPESTPPASSPGAESNIPSPPPEGPVVPQPAFVETGVASWYGPPYHNRRASDGEIYNMNALTAAHRTLPLGSIVRVTNVKTHHSVVVRITDRGPFIRGRVIDLSLAAARKVDVYKAGVARVRVEVMQTPAPINSGGKWAVQIGGLPQQEEANRLADNLTRRFRTAKVLRFQSPTGDWWVRVRVPNDDHDRATRLAAETKTPEGGVFLVRLD